MPASRTCPQCAAPLPEDAPQGLCPSCLFRQGLESASGADTVTLPGAAGRSAKAPSSPDAPATSGIGRLGEAMTLEQIRVFFPQLDILELLGRGGMGVVYKARQKHLDRLVALKILSAEFFAAPAFAERFSREAKALARLSHPHIVGVHDFGKAQPAGADPAAPATPSLYYLLMEYVDGANLRQLIKSLTPAQALAIIPQICDALQFAHDEGVVHRDIKPENILIDKKGRVKIADFGLAKLLQGARGQTDYTLTHPDRIMGTLHYMAPEQLERPTEVDHRADIYSLGVVFYELLTGQLPLGRFALPSERAPVDARLDQVVLRTLEHAPEKRYQHASEVKTSVETIAGTSGGGAVPGSGAKVAEGARAFPADESLAPEPGVVPAKPAPQLSTLAVTAVVLVGIGLVCLAVGIVFVIGASQGEPGPGPLPTEFQPAPGKQQGQSNPPIPEQFLPLVPMPPGKAEPGASSQPLKHEGAATASGGAK